jgi:hypothetical protein
LDTILATQDTTDFRRCFVAWVSAVAARQRLVLGQMRVAGKANESVAIPKLLDRLAISGPVVAIDAMGCQRAIAQQTVDKKVDYMLAPKGDYFRRVSKPEKMRERIFFRILAAP